ncbi:MAG: cupin domain-containing protein [Rhodanobacter sp.]
MTRTWLSLSITVLALATALHVDARPMPPQQRLNPAEIDAAVRSGAGAGSSGVSGIQTIMLKGDAAKPGVYMIRLIVPAHTRIMPHDHPDDRVATVVSGTWFFGYGDRFNAKALKALPPGSFYTEPPRQPHFAQTGDSAVIVDISGYGPTGTHYEDSRNAPVSTGRAARVVPNGAVTGRAKVVSGSAIDRSVTP